MLEVLPQRSQPRLWCRPQCLGSGAAHHTGGRQEGGSPREASAPATDPGDTPSLFQEPTLVFLKCVSPAPLSAPPPCPMELWGGTEGLVPRPSLVPLDCDKWPVRDS